MNHHTHLRVIAYMIMHHIMRAIRDTEVHNIHPIAAIVSRCMRPQRSHDGLSYLGPLMHIKRMISLLCVLLSLATQHNATSGLGT